jgi:hypothetical protein
MATMLVKRGSQYSRVESAQEAKSEPYDSWERLEQYLLGLEFFKHYPEKIKRVKAELDSKGNCDLDAVAFS